MNVVSAAVVAAALLTVAPAVSLAQAPPQVPPAQKPAAQPTPAPPPAKPFPAGARIAVIDLQRVATESAEGKASAAKIKSLNDKKVAELNERNRAVQAAQQKLVAGALLTDAAKTQIQRDIDRMNREIQRFTQDAQAEVEELQQQVQMDFQRRLMPIIELVAVDKGVQIVFANDNGLVWLESAIDLTAEVIRRFDGAMGVAPPKQPSVGDPPTGRHPIN